MLHRSTITSTILPIGLVFSSFLLLVTIWTNKRMNKSLADDLGRAETELEMVLYQADFCRTVTKEKEADIIENRKQEEEINKLLKKAAEDRTTVNIMKTKTNIELENTKIAKYDVIESAILFQRQLDQVAADITKQENIKIALENKM
jgi:hypothetical protein